MIRPRHREQPRLGASFAAPRAPGHGRSPADSVGTLLGGGEASSAPRTPTPGGAIAAKLRLAGMHKAAALAEQGLDENVAPERPGSSYRRHFAFAPEGRSESGSEAQPPTPTLPSKVSPAREGLSMAEILTPNLRRERPAVEPVAWGETPPLETPRPEV